METSNQKSQIANRLLQHLNYLAKAGIETLPAGNGESNFHFADVAAQQEPATVEAVAPIPVNTSFATSATSPADTKLANQSLEVKKSSLSSVNEQSSLYSKVNEKRSGVSATIGETADETAYPPSLSLEQRRLTLEQVSEKVTACTLCTELVSCRSRVVFGVGNITPKLVFLGEAPGADEDRVGEPFVGAAGQLLDKIMKACKLKRSDVYLLNTIKCRPPRNRNPEPLELANCWQFTEQQLEVLRPEFICCLGAVASRQLLKTTSPLGQLRQKFHRYRESKVVVTYHPTYLLRTESAKKHVWEDMKMLLHEMGIEL